MEIRGIEFLELLSGSRAEQMLEGTAQSFLFCSPDTDALLLLAELLARREGGSLSSPDVKILPEGEKITVADIDTITQSAAITPLRLAHKLYILKNGETLGDAAANKLLKTLEEPPAIAKIIILSPFLEGVLPTIRSRCRVVSLPPLDDARLSAIADRVYAKNPLLGKAKDYAQGSLTRLLRTLDGGYELAERLAYDTLLGMRNSRNQAKFAAELLKNKDSFAEVLDMCELILSDVARLCCGAECRINQRESDKKAIADFYSLDTILRQKTAFERARERLRLYGNMSGIIDEFLFSLLEIRQKTQG